MNGKDLEAAIKAVFHDQATPEQSKRVAAWLENAWGKLGISESKRVPEPPDEAW